MPGVRFTLAVLGLAALSCGVVATEESTSSAAQRTSSGSVDPLDHLRIIAAPEMAGRGTPSVGLDRAADYIVGECVRAGLQGGVADSVYKQPFRLGLRIAAPTDDPLEHFGSELFEEGIFLSGEASPENLLADNGGTKIRRMTTMLTSTIEKLTSATFPMPDGGI